MTRRAPILSESTLIPISLTFAIGALVFWAGTMASRVQQNTDDAKALRQEFAKHERNDESIDARLASLETKVGLIYDAIRIQQKPARK